MAMPGVERHLCRHRARAAVVHKVSMGKQGVKPMPSKSAKQKRTMAAAAHNPKFAKKMGIPVKVAKEFNEADQAKAKRKK
jgi:hypothetical protein